MNILLIQPQKLHNIKSSRGTLPISLLYLASSLRKANYKPEILDLSIKIPPNNIESNIYYLSLILDKIKNTNPKLVCINCFSSMHFPFVRKITKYIHSNFPNIKICVGGAHPSFYSREILENCPEIDYVIMGEGEDIVTKLANVIESNNYFYLNDIQSITYRINKEIFINPRKNFIEHLDDLPIPAYDMINFKDYFTDHSNWYNPKHKNIKLAIPILTTRSCPFNCNFCSAHSIMGRKFRKRDPKKVVDEIEILVKKYEQNYFSFIDDNVNFDKEHFIAICKDISKRNLDIQLSIAQGMHISSIDEDIIRAFVDAGGITVSVPIESGNTYIRNKIIGKNLKEEKIYDITNLLKKYKIFTVGLYIMGFAEDTSETLNDTLQMINKLGLDVNGVNVLIPFPGTRVYQQAKENNLLLFDDSQFWNGETFLDPLNKLDFFIKPYNLTIEEMINFREKFNNLYFFSDRAKILNNKLS